MSRAFGVVQVGAGTAPVIVKALKALIPGRKTRKSDPIIKRRG